MSGDDIHGLGRLPFVSDERDYPLKPLLMQLPDAPPKLKKWPNTEPVMDQMSTKHCVGMGCAQWGNTLPVNSKLNVYDAHNIYYESLVKGCQPREENGSQVRWGLKAMAARGMVVSYHLSHGYDEALAWVRNPEGGSVILGINWYEHFNRPNLWGVIKMGGDIVGGHCLLWYGSSDTHDYWLNSWGRKWGWSGTCRIKREFARKVIEEDGEAWVAVERALP